MNNKKKIVVTIWLFLILLLAMFFMLPAKADRYFLSSRVFNDEQKLIQTSQKTNVFAFLRSPTDNDQLLKMLQERMHEDRKGLAIHIGLIFLACNIMACFLYVFSMKPIRIVGLVLAYALIGTFLVMQSLIRINP